MKNFFAGLGLGFAAGVLLAPRAGAETRRALNETVVDSLQRSREAINTAERKLRRTATEVVQQLSPATRQMLAVINEWPKERLIAIDGIGPVLADKIIQNRPYESPEELAGSKLLPPSAIEALQKAG